MKLELISVVPQVLPDDWKRRYWMHGKGQADTEALCSSLKSRAPSSQQDGGRGAGGAGGIGVGGVAWWETIPV